MKILKCIGRFFLKLLKLIWRKIYRYFVIITEDQIAVYAAQAAFFIIVSSIPFIILLLALAKYVIDIGWLLNLIDSNVDGQLGSILSTMVHDVVDQSGASLLSITIITTLWSASRGVNAVTKGISEAYKVHLKENFLLDILRSFIYTFVFMLIIIASLVALVFAETIYKTASLTGEVPMVEFIFRAIYNAAPLVLTIVLTVLFAAVFNAVARKGRRFSREEYKGLRDRFPRGYLAQLPGAVFAAVGWVVFSVCFSRYFLYFPEASYIYGSLTTIMLFMLWLYFSMFIFMLGAEVNKAVFNRWNISRIRYERRKEKKRKKKEQKLLRESCQDIKKQ